MMNTRFSEEELEQLKHPDEDLRFALALICCLPTSLMVFFVSFLVPGYFPVILLGIIALLWLAHALTKAYLIGNKVRVSPHNFPEIHQMVEDVKYRLDYDREVQVFIVSEGSVNAFLAKIFRFNYIVLNSELVEDMLSTQNIIQLKWVIARFIGALKTKERRPDIFRLALDSIESLKVLNIFILPYERATQLTGDNIGLAVCGNLPEAIKALDKFLVGNHLASQVNLIGILEQGRETQDSHLARMARLLAPHPHAVERYLNLLALGRTHFPKQYETYIRHLGFGTIYEMRRTLPDFYNGDQPLYTGIDSSNQVRRNDSHVRGQIKISKRHPPLFPPK
jgi:hypothetical protein